MSAMTYAIGDVHGRFDALSRALAWIGDHGGREGGTIVLLGDYVDRGPQSREVVEILAGETRLLGLGLVCLMGNHEAMLVDAMRDPGARRHWLLNGGDATLASYGGTIPPAHVAWMAGLPRIHQDRHRIFVHAGLNPRRPVDGQDDADLLWIREPFLRSTHDFGKHVVHGHTPDPNGPELLPFRTNLDTGAFWTGRLSIGVFDPSAPGGPVETVSVSA